MTDYAGFDHDAAISFGMPYEPEDSQIWESRANISWGCTLSGRSYLEEIKTELEEGRSVWGV